MFKPKPNFYPSPSAANRHGATAIEVAVFVGLITIGILATLHALGSSTTETFSQITAQLEQEDQSTDRSNLYADETLQLANQIKNLKNQSNLVAGTCLICLLVAGALYLRLARKRKVDLETKQEEVAEIQKQSLALRKILSKRNSILSRVDENLESILHGHALVGTYMSTGVVCIEPEVSKRDALKRMHELGFRRFIVKRKNGDLAGVISKKDILSKAGELVSEVMTSEPKTTTPDTQIQSALSVLLENRISCLPVVDDGKFVGLLSVSDLLMVLQCLLRDLSVRAADFDCDLEHATPEGKSFRHSMSPAP